MPTIYISDRGDDNNDGLSLQTPVYSLKRAQKLQGGKKLPCAALALRRNIENKRLLGSRWTSTLRIQKLR